MMGSTRISWVRRLLDERRWLVWTGGIALLALAGMFPLRAALALSNLERIGFTARQVAGTVWYGRMGEFQLRSQPLGTLEVSLDPAALLLGHISMDFRRMDSPMGTLRGELVSGLRRGIKDATGRIAVAQMLAPLPVEAFELDEVTVLFRDGTCVRADGRVRTIVNAPVGAEDISGLEGEIKCDGERARAIFERSGGTRRMEFYVGSSGNYRAWLTIRSVAPEMNAALVASGFRPGPEGMTLSVEGQL